MFSLLPVYKGMILLFCTSVDLSSSGPNSWNTSTKVILLTWNIIQQLGDNDTVQDVLVRNLEPFTSNHVEDWQMCLSRSENYYKANKIEDGGRSPFSSLILLIQIWLLEALTAPNKVDQVTSVERQRVLTSHSTAKEVNICGTLPILESQSACLENNHANVVALRRIARNCDSGEGLEELTRERFAWRIRDAAICKKLLTIDDLTLHVAVKKAIAQETVECEVAIRSILKGSEHSKEAGRKQAKEVLAQWRKWPFRKCLQAEPTCAYCKSQGIRQKYAESANMYAERKKVQTEIRRYKYCLCGDLRAAGSGCQHTSDFLQRITYIRIRLSGDKSHWCEHQIRGGQRSSCKSSWSSHFTLQCTALWSQSLVPVSDPSLWSQSLIPVSDPSLWSQSLIPVSDPSLWSQSLIPVSDPSLWSQSLIPVSDLSLWSQYLIPVSGHSLWSQSLVPVSDPSLVTREESWETMAEWMTLDGLYKCQFFRCQHLM